MTRVECDGGIESEILGEIDYGDCLGPGHPDTVNVS